MGTFYIGPAPEHEPEYYGYGFSFWFNFDGEEMQVHVTEKFLLVIHGEVKWLKEMFDVEMIILNTSGTDTIENCEAQLILPEGLSLATMRSDLQPQTLRQSVPEIGSNQTHTVHWYVRGDAQGSYDIAATLDGMMMPFEEPFHYEYEAEDPITVYAGSAMELTFEVPDVVYYGTDAVVRITLTNTSPITLYNVSHTIGKVEQNRLIYRTEDGVTAVDTELQGFDTGGTIRVSEFKPGDQLIIELTIEIAFDAKALKNKFKSIIDQIESLSGMIDSVNNVVDAFDSASGAAEDLSGFLSDANAAIEAGELTEEALHAAESFEKLTDYMEFGAGTGTEPSTPGFFGMLRDLVESLPIRYVMEDATVKTLEESTTYIPHRIIVVPGPASNPLIPAGSISMSKLIYSIAVVLIGDVDVTVGGMTLVKDASGKQEAMEYVTYVWEQTAAIRAVDPSGEVQFSAWYEPADPTDTGWVQVQVSGGKDITMGEDGVLYFVGPGIIEATPQRSARARTAAPSQMQGTLYVQAGDAEPKAYQITVVEPHECSGDDWVVEVPATENTTGYKVRYCDICDEIIEVAKMQSCGDHSFAPYILEAAPGEDTLGIQTRTCTCCGVLEYRLIDTLPVASVSELLTADSGTVVERNGAQYLVLAPDMTPEAFLDTLTAPQMAYREDADGLISTEKPLATGQLLKAEGGSGVLTLIVPGDLNGDGTVTAEETAAALRMSVYGPSGTDAQILAADLDCDGTVALQEVGVLMSAAGKAADSGRLFFAVYTDDGKLLRAYLPEGERAVSAAELLTETAWGSVKLFLAEQTALTPLAESALCLCE